VTIAAVVGQHAEEAAFQWLLRDSAVSAPHYDLADLAKLDGRVDAHIDGLRIAGDQGWNLCAEALEHQEAGEVFAAAVLALESEDQSRFEKVFSAAQEDPSTVRGLVSALGWVSQESLRGTVKGLLSSPDPLRRRVGIAACALHRVHPKDALGTAIGDEEEALQSRALRAVGELGRTDLAGRLQATFQAEDASCRFWAAWASVLTGNRTDALELLRFFGTVESAFRIRAMQVALRVMTPASSRQWLKGLRDGDGALRDVLVGVGIGGDPSYVPWLITQTDAPAVARVAGEAFTMIVGVDLASEDLEGEWPEGFEAGPTDNPEDENVAMDADEDLPWPDRPLVQKWWDANKIRFTPGQRYLVGQPITAAHCQDVLRTGYQRQRNAAAFELALMEPEAPLFETRAPGFRQQRQLACTPSA